MSKVHVTNTSKRILATHVDGDIVRFVPGEATPMDQSTLYALRLSPAFEFCFQNKELVAPDYDADKAKAEYEKAKAEAGSRDTKPGPKDTKPGSK